MIYGYPIYAAFLAVIAALVAGYGLIALAHAAGAWAIAALTTPRHARHANRSHR